MCFLGSDGLDKHVMDIGSFDIWNMKFLDPELCELLNFDNVHPKDVSKLNPCPLLVLHSVFSVMLGAGMPGPRDVPTRKLAVQVCGLVGFGIART